MYQAEIAGPWVVVNGANVIKLSQDFAHLSGSDTTGQPIKSIIPDPNLVVVRVECEADVLDAIEADGDYLVLWSEEVGDAEA